MSDPTSRPARPHPAPPAHPATAPALSTTQTGRPADDQTPPATCDATGTQHDHRGTALGRSIRNGHRTRED